jgi:hypothetical protein
LWLRRRRQPLDRLSRDAVGDPNSLSVFQEAAKFGIVNEGDGRAFAKESGCLLLFAPELAERPP